MTASKTEHRCKAKASTRPSCSIALKLILELQNSISESDPQQKKVNTKFTVRAEQPEVTYISRAYLEKQLKRYVLEEDWSVDPLSDFPGDPYTIP